MRQTQETVSPMSNEGRNAYVCRQLTDACFTLLKEKPLSAISICELCDTAGVGRASFYRNYESREDIVREYIHQLFSGWLEAYGQWEGKALSSLIEAMFTHFEEHREFYQLLNERHLIYLLKDVILGICGLKPEDAGIEAYSRAYVGYTLYGWIEVWFWRGMKESAQEMAQLFREQGL